MLDATERRALRAVATQFFVNGFVFASFVPRLPEIRDRIGVDLATIGLLLTLGGLSGFVSSGVVSRLVTRFGTRRLLAVTGVLLSASLPIMGFATTPVVFVVGAMCLSSFDVFVDVAMNIQGSRLSARRHTPVMNRLHALWSTGTVLGGILASRLAATDVPISRHLLAVGIFMSGVVIVVSRFLLRSDDPAAPAGATPTSGAHRAGVGGRTSLLFAVLGFAAVLPEIGASDWVSFRGTDDLGVSPGLAGLGFVAFTTGMVIGRFSGDAAQVRLGDQRMLSSSVVLAASGVVVMTLIPAFPAVLVGAVVTGLGVSVLFPALYDMAASAGGSNSGALGSMTAGTRVGFLALPLLVGGIADTSVTGVGGAMAIVSLPALAVVWGARRVVR